jgi:secreted trypsin-like serine protease
MRKKVFVSLAVLVLLAVVVVPAAAINGGETDDEGKYPNVGAMVYDHPVHGWWQTCSGTLIHQRVFLTAGHCTDRWDEPDAEPVWVNFDKYALNVDEFLNVVKVITHPGYNNFQDPSNTYDVGVLILEEPVTEITPAQLPTEGYLDELKNDGLLRVRQDGAQFTVVGYGGTVAGWPPPDIQYYDERQFAESEYVALVPAQLHLSQHMSTNSQWYSDDDEGGTCFGDSGGPVFWTEEDGTEILVGITSWGDAQCVATGYNYRVDIADTLGFIEGVINDLE